MKTLIADDDATSRVMLEATMHKIGFDPTSVSDGRSAWEAMQKPDAPRLLLLDWNMPDISGLDICRMLRSRDTDDPPYVILFTARDAKADIVRGLDAGANDYITKPCDHAELRARLQVAARMLDLQEKLLEARKQLTHQALHDVLTGIFNRRAIMDNLARELSRTRRESQALNIGLYDLDHFKQVNDTHGHKVGDEALLGFVRKVQQHVRDYTAIGRYGGEEFIVLISGAPERQCELVHERIRAAVADAPIATSAGPISLTVSAGVACARPESTVDSLIDAADRALYAAKKAGRNRVVAGSG